MVQINPDINTAFWPPTEAFLQQFAKKLFILRPKYMVLIFFFSVFNVALACGNRMCSKEYMTVTRNHLISKGITSSLGAQTCTVTYRAEKLPTLSTSRRA